MAVNDVSQDSFGVANDNTANDDFDKGVTK